MRTSPSFIVVALCLALGACQSAPEQPAPDAGAPAPAATQAVIRGKATYLQRIALAPGATLRVQLIDSQLADTPAAVLADRTFTGLAGPPYAFALPYDPGKLRPGGMYGLQASLRDADGRLMFVTDTRVPFTPGQDDVGEFRMRMVQHDGNGPSTQAPDASPWEQAKARGIGFRAVGNEPGWLVEVGSGKTPALHAELDYGQRVLDVRHVQTTARGFRGNATDGTRITLDIERVPCRDDMSGQPFPAKATLQVGDKSYSGCGVFLDD